MSTTLKQARASKKTGASTFLMMLVVSLIATLAIGCGSSRDEFVFTGTGTQQGPAGSLTFNFVQAQATEVPVGTTNVKFELFDGNNATGAKTVNPDPLRAFAAQIVLNNVPTSTQSVRVTAYNADGLPTRVFVVNVTVIPGINTEVGDMGAGTPVVAEGLTVTPTNASINVGNSQQFTAAISFTNGEVLSRTSADGLAWSTPPGSPATIAQTGIATGVAAGTAAITGSFGGQSDTVNLEVTAIDPGLTLVSVELEVDPETDIALGETVTFTVFGNFEDEEGAETRENITGNPDFTIALNVDDEDADPSVLTADENNPFLFTGTAEGTATVEAVVSGGGLEEPLESNEIDVTVAAPTFRVYGLEEGETDEDNPQLLLPRGAFTWGILVESVHPNGTVTILGADAVTVDFVNGDDPAITSIEELLLTSGPGPGDAVVSIFLGADADPENDDPIVVFDVVTEIITDSEIRFQFFSAEANDGDGGFVDFSIDDQEPTPLIEGSTFQVRTILVSDGGADFVADVTTSPLVNFGGDAFDEETGVLEFGDATRRTLDAIAETGEDPVQGTATLDAGAWNSSIAFDFDFFVEVEAP